MTDPIADIRAERARQDEKWGEQNHPDGTGPTVYPLLIDVGMDVEVLPADHLAEAFTFATDRNAKQRTVTWRDILLEEVFEALAEDDLEKLRTELIQVAAVASQWAEAIDRRS